MLFHLTACVILTTSTFGNTIIIRSDPLTNWGSWGPLEKCPEGSFVKAINIKIERDQGKGDNSAMNAVYLSCVPLEYQVTDTSFHLTKVLTSAEGPWGKLQGVDICYRGVAVGFQLRVEEYQRNGDDTATNDMRLICASSKGTSFTKGKGTHWGSWGEEKRCPPKTAICGLETQVQTDLGEGDDTALNNVGVLCCDVPNPADLCNPTDDWHEILRRDNSQGTTPMKYTLKETVGVRKAVDTSRSYSVSEELSLSVGFGRTTSFRVLATNFEAKLGLSAKTELSWSQRQTSVFSSETQETMELFIPPKCETSLYKVVGKCGFYVVNTNVIKRVDNCIGGRRVTRVGNDASIWLANAIENNSPLVKLVSESGGPTSCSFYFSTILCSIFGVIVRLLT